MRTFTTQLWREVWEHPVFYLAPAVIGALSLVLFGLTLFSGMGSDSVIQVNIVHTDAAAARPSGAAVTIALLALSWVFFLPLAVIVTFYLLDALGAERRDRSILFFKSLPISDTQIVLSKLTTALLVAPALTVAALVATQLGVLLLASATALGAHVGLAALWDIGRLLSIWVFAVYGVIAFGLWFAPSLCFLLAVSAWARRATFLWAASPLLLVLVEHAFRGHSALGSLLLAHSRGFFTTAFSHSIQIAVGDEQAQALLRDAHPSGLTNVWEWMNPIGLLSSPMLWIGLLVAAGFTGAAILVRRYRDDT